MGRVNRSAGVLIYRSSEARLEVLLVHPGGPFWRNRDQGAWQIAKGGIGENEAVAVAICRLGPGRDVLVVDRKERRAGAGGKGDGVAIVAEPVEVDTNHGHRKPVTLLKVV